MDRYTIRNMSKFRIIPVLDILNAKAVHAKKGKREMYKPLNLKMVKSSDPIEIIEILHHNYDFSEFYLADLDAILKNKPNFELISNILKIPDIKIMIDPGIRS